MALLVSGAAKGNARTAARVPVSAAPKTIITAATEAVAVRSPMMTPSTRSMAR